MSIRISRMKQIRKVISCLIILAVLIGSFPSGAGASSMQQTECDWVVGSESGMLVNVSPPVYVPRYIYGYRIEVTAIFAQDGLTMFYADVTNVTDEYKKVTLLDIWFLDENQERIMTIGGIISALKPGYTGQINASVTSTAAVYAEDYTISIVSEEDTEEDEVASGSAVEGGDDSNQEEEETYIGGYIPGGSVTVNRNQNDEEITKNENEEAFLVSMEEGEQVTYQWYRSWTKYLPGTPIRGEMERCYDFTAERQYDEAYYYCRIYKDGYIYESDRCQLHVIWSKNLQIQPAEETLVPGEEFTLNTYSDFSMDGYTYSWFYADEQQESAWKKLIGETGASLTVRAPEEGVRYYRCLVTNVDKEEEIYSNIFAAEVQTSEDIDPEVPSESPSAGEETSAPTVTEPVEEGAVPSTTEPVAESATPTVTEPVEESAVPSTTEPVAESATPSVTEPVEKSDTPTVTESAGEGVQPSTTAPGTEETQKNDMSAETSGVASDASRLYTAKNIQEKITAKQKVRLCWEKQKKLSGYVIWRADKMDGKYQEVCQVKGGQTNYLDTTVSRGKTYYYKVAGYQGEYPGKSSLKNIMAIQVKVPYLKKPEIAISKGTGTDGRKYVQVRLKKYAGKYAEIYVKREGGYTRLSLENNMIQRYKGRFRFVYQEENAKLYFRIKTYVIQGTKKRYSAYSDEVGIRT